jgi:hypothetical protein
LAIVSQVVKDEGGTITAEAADDGGTRMSLRLPTVAAPADAEGEETDPAETADTADRTVEGGEGDASAAPSGP